MGLKPYTLRLDEEEYEKLKGYLGRYGDPDLNISFILRRYIRDLNESLPNLEKSEFNLLNTLSFYATGLKQLFRTGQLENLMKGSNLIGDKTVLDCAQLEIDDRKQYKAMKDKQKKK